MTDVMTIRCPPDCEPDCHVAHHPLLIALLNTLPKDGNPTSFTALEATISRYEKIGEWSKDGDIPDPVVKFRYPLLIWAASLGMIDVVQWLKSHQFSQVARCSVNNEGALHVFIKHLWEKRTGNPVKDPTTYLQKLLPLLPGALTVRDNDGNSPLHLCCDLFAQDVIHSLIFQECAMIMLDFAMEKNQAIVSTLVNTQNNSGNTPVHLLTLHDRCFKLVKHICGLEKADISIKNCMNQTPIEMAVENGAIKISSFLSTSKSATKMKKGDGDLFSDEEMPRRKRKVQSCPDRCSLEAQERKLTRSDLCNLNKAETSNKLVHTPSKALNHPVDFKLLSNGTSPRKKGKLGAQFKEKTSAKEKHFSSKEDKTLRSTQHSQSIICNANGKITGNKGRVSTQRDETKSFPYKIPSTTQELLTRGQFPNFQMSTHGQSHLSKQSTQHSLRPDNKSRKNSPIKKLERLYFSFPPTEEVKTPDGHSNAGNEKLCSSNSNVDAIIISSADGKGMSLVKSDSNRLQITKLSAIDQALVRPLCKAGHEAVKPTEVERPSSSQMVIKVNTAESEKKTVSSSHLKKPENSNFTAEDISKTSYLRQGVGNCSSLPCSKGNTPKDPNAVKTTKAVTCPIHTIASIVDLTTTSSAQSSQISQVSSSVCHPNTSAKTSGKLSPRGKQSRKSWVQMPGESTIKIEILDDDDSDENTVTSGLQQVSEQRVSTTSGKSFKREEDASSTTESPSSLAFTPAPQSPVISNVISLAASTTSSPVTSNTQNLDFRDSIPTSSSCMSEETRKLIHDSIQRDKEKTTKEKKVILKSKRDIKKIAQEARQTLVTKNQRIQTILKELEVLQREVLVLGNMNAQHIKSEEKIEQALKDIEAKEAAYEKALAEIGTV